MRGTTRASTLPWTVPLLTVVTGVVLMIVIAILLVSLTDWTHSRHWREPSRDELPSFTTPIGRDGPEEPYSRLTVSLPGDDRIRVGVDRWIRLDELPEILRGHRFRHDVTGRRYGWVMIRAHARTPWRQVLAVVLAAGDVGIDVVGFPLRKGEPYQLAFVRPPGGTTDTELRIEVLARGRFRFEGRIGDRDETVRSVVARVDATRDSRAVAVIDADPSAPFQDVISAFEVVERSWVVWTSFRPE